MGLILSFTAPVLFLVIGFVISVAAGAARSLDDVHPINPLAAMLAALVFLTIQAVLWVVLGIRIWGA